LADRRYGRRATEGLRGFTILELTVVLSVGLALLAFAGWSFSGYVHRTAAQRAAQVFALDLAVAREAAIRGREPVVIRFFESGRWYRIAMGGTDTEIVRRRFTGSDLRVAEIDLVTAGDSLVFSSRGVAELGGGLGSLGEARFSSGDRRYSVFFNGMGASRVEES